MDFTNNKINFGEGTVWRISFKCAWCTKGIKNQSEQNYKLFGNMCRECSADITNKVMQTNQERLVTQRGREISKAREEMDLLGDCLNYQVSEEERQELVSKMELLYTKIRLLKSLC